ncbi:MAG: hypothetical protein HYY93_00485 [Planctomycetes bacterium]|nr:hypothetical protein [Planctomycetota bacterium]
MLPSRALAVVLVLSFAAPPLASGQSAEAVRALEKYRESRPTDDDLAMYRPMPERRPRR